MGRIREITSEKEMWEEKMTWQDAERKIKDSFKEQAYLYLELDNQVLLGRYEEGMFRFLGPSFDDKCAVFSHKETPQNPAGSSGEWNDTTLGNVWNSLQRLIVFTENQELRLYRNKERFCGRLRRDCPCDHTIYVTDEDQKIWGSIWREDGNWLMVKSQRGSTIWIPDEPEVWGREEKIGKYMGIMVRKYIEFPDASKGCGLAAQVDERMVGIYPWPHREGSV